MPDAHPAPQTDIESAALWDAYGHHRLQLQRCSACGRLRHPPMPACPYCGSTERTEVTVSGDGAVYSFVRVHRALTPGMADEVPYVVAVVELAEGPRLLARVGDGASRIAIGDRVAPAFVDHDGWTELRFDLVDGVRHD